MVSGMAGLDLDLLRDFSYGRQREVFTDLHDWSPTDWACALAGEVGEACNLIKKLRRGEDVSRERIGEELADTLIYLDLLAQRLDIDLAAAVVNKFNADSEKRGSKWRL